MVPSVLHRGEPGEKTPSTHLCLKGPQYLLGHWPWKAHLGPAGGSYLPRSAGEGQGWHPDDPCPVLGRPHQHARACSGDSDWTVPCGAAWSCVSDTSEERWLCKSRVEPLSSGMTFPGRVGQGTAMAECEGKGADLFLRLRRLGQGDTEGLTEGPLVHPSDLWAPQLSDPSSSPYPRKGHP